VFVFFRFGFALSGRGLVKRSSPLGFKPRLVALSTKRWDARFAVMT